MASLQSANGKRVCRQLTLKRISFIKVKTFVGVKCVQHSGQVSYIGLMIIKLCDDAQKVFLVLDG